MSKNKAKTESRRATLKENRDWREKLIARIEELASIKPDFVLCEEEIAVFLNVSLEYVQKLVKNGKIHEFMTVKEAVSYKRDHNSDRREALSDLTSMSQDFGGYESDSD